MRIRNGLGILFLCILLLVSIVCTVGIGSVDLSIHDVVHVIFRRLGWISGQDVTQLEDHIVWNMRLPRALAAVAIGAVLAVCGAILQTLMGNPLADPYLLGISSGASVGAVAVLVFGVPLGMLLTTAKMLAAFLGAVGALFLVFLLSTGKDGELSPTRTVLGGVAVAQLCAAATSLMIMVFGENHSAQVAMSWSLGSLAATRWSSAITLMIVGCIALLLFFRYARTLDAFSFGDITASSLGIRVTRTRWVLLTTTALTTAIIVSFVGPIGFVGLVVPHCVRPIVGSTHGALLPASALCGAIILLWSDTIARTIAGTEEIPLGIVTAILGTPVLIILLRKQARA